MTTLTLLLPEMRHVAPLDSSQRLARWISRGDRLPDARKGRDVALREFFEFIGSTFPHAAFARAAESNDATDAVWINADPAFAMADAVTIRMMAIGSIGLTREESDALAKPLKLLFGDAGFPLEVLPSGRWQLRCPKETRLPNFASPNDVLGDDLGRHLPTGDNEKRWRHLLNEAQVILHNHPVNASRAARGQVPANSLWFWGAGALPDWMRSKLKQVVSADPEVRTMAKLANVPFVADRIDDVDLGTNGDTLIDGFDIRTPSHLDVYLDKADKALKSKSVFELRLAFESGERFVYRSSHRWRFWRSVRPLAMQ